MRASGRVAAALLSSVAVFERPALGQSLPTGGAVTAGSAAIARPTATSLVVNQSSAAAILNWSTFSIGQSYQVQFNNGAGATLNRVTGNVPSSIAGTLSATGSVYLVNPAGIVVGPTGRVTTGGSFVGSTLDVHDDKFLAGGPLTFGGASQASVVNLGKIGSSHGDVVLIARQVRNEGTVSAKNGTAALASGSEVTISDGSLGNGKVSVRLPSQDGEVLNRGTIRAAEVELHANGGNVYGLAGNTGGAIVATGVARQGGRIFLTAQGGSVTTTQQLVARRAASSSHPPAARSSSAPRRDRPAAGGAGAMSAGGDIRIEGDAVLVGGPVSARGNGAAGGTVVVTGGAVTLAPTAAIDASGTAGGIVLIGGDRGGGADPSHKLLPGTIATAQTTTVAAGATIRADGTAGAGGSVVVWADGTTTAHGVISAQGASAGGFVETSGHSVDVNGLVVTTATPSGPAGTWLIDPTDLTIDATAAATIAANLASNNVTVQTNADGSTSGPGTTASGPGDITVAAPVTWATANTLTLNAYRSIDVNASLASTGGGNLVLRADNTGTGVGTVSFAPGTTVSTAGAVTILYNPSVNPAGSAVNATSYVSPTESYAGNLTGGGTLTAAMLVNTVNDLQNIKNNLGGSYALGRSIDAGATASWNSGAGFVPLGTDGTGGVLNGGLGFAGSLNGQGQTISGLVINRPSANYVGLIGSLSGAVSNIGLVGGSVSGAWDVGGLVGYNSGTVASSYATGAVTGGTYAGGLVGLNWGGTVATSYATGAVTGYVSIGGLVGGNDIHSGTVETSYASGAVTGYFQTGGLVGSNSGTVATSYASGAVTGPDSTGGLVGLNSGGTVASSYATGAVTGQLYAGGLVGQNLGGTVTNAYWDTATSGQASGAGGIGLTTAQLQSGGLPPGFDQAVWGGGSNGLYPYLSNFYPNGVQAISGFAYTDAGAKPLASGGAGAVTVGLIAAGQSLGAATTGANGYYYIVAPNGAVVGGASLLAYTPGPTPAATLSSATGATAQTGLNLYGGALTVPTAATTLSTAPSLSQAKVTAAAAAGGSSAASAAVDGSTGLGLAAAGASFTIDQPVATGSTFLVQTTAANAPITVARPITITGTGSLGLLASGALTVDQTVSVQGAGSINLAASPQPGIATTGLTFGTGASIDYGLTNQGGMFTLNGQPYTLLYSMTGVETINSNLAGKYALATDLDAGGRTYSTGVIAGGDSSETAPAPFSGMLDGLGHTIAGLNISASSNYYVGLIGYSTGTVSNIGLVGGSVAGNQYTGGLVGANSGTVATSHATGAVTGGAVTGGLVGQNDGTVASSYATGAVTGGFGNTGGLVGFSGGTVASSYATGAVTGSSTTGGLVGLNSGTVASSYASGAVTGQAFTGGLVGVNFGGTITNAYWDTATSGQSSSDGGIGLTTAQLQSDGLPPGFDQAVWDGGGNGLYPYLSNFYPNGVQAISGFAYTDAGAKPLASGGAGAVTVGLIAAGQSLGAATTGANGYYYIVAPAGAVVGGASLLAYTPGPTPAATLSSATGATAQTGLNLYGGALTVPTTATTLSAAPSLSQAQATAAAGGNSAASAAVGGSTGLGLVAAGASFTIDQPVATGSTFLVQTTAANAPITVAQPITITGTGSLGLLASGALAVDRTVSVQGAGSIKLAASPQPGIATTGLTFGTGASIDYGPTNQGGMLTLNGQPYTLLYGMTGVETINSNLAGNYALATALDAGGRTYSTGVIAGGDNSGTAPAPFSGMLDGLGHTIAGLNISASSNSHVGLIGHSTGTVSNIGLLGGNVAGLVYTGGLVGFNGGTVTGSYTTGAVTGSNFYTGGLVGYNRGTVASSYATGAVTGSGDYTGGLVGFNGSSGTVASSYATGAVTSGALTGNAAVAGGLVGFNSGTVASSYATGAVTGSGDYTGGLVGFNSGTVSTSYATGAVTGSGFYTGGLVGYNFAGTVASSYATGAVTGQAFTGGLVGVNFAGTVASSYATGAVTGQAFTGGLVGVNFGGTITNAYWDTATSGQPSSDGGIGLTTAHLQSGGLPPGFDPAVWGGGGNGLYPYLRNFYPNGVQAISGFAYTDAGVKPLASGGAGAVTVGLIAAGQSLGAATTGANGYYYIVAPNGAVVDGASLLAYTPGPTPAATLSSATGAMAQTGLNLYGGALTLPTAATALSAAPNLLQAKATATAAAGGNSAASAAVGGSTGRGLVAAGASFTIDRPVATGSTFLVQTTAANAPITVAQPITITGTGSLGLLASGAVAVDQTVSVQGAGSIKLAASPQPGIATTGLTFGTGASIDFGPTNQGGMFTLNGQPYTLVYNMTGVETINNNLAGNHALATDLDAGGRTYSTGVIAGGGDNFLFAPAPFSGMLDGLGHTIAGLNISASSNSYVGLIGYSAGTVSNIGLLGGNVAGLFYTGGLVGANSGTVATSYATGAVTGSRDYTGGLVGYNAAGTVASSYATGAVTGSGSYTGGLVGNNNRATVASSYASGAVTGGVFATGGLVGLNAGTVATSYATGAVTGQSSTGGLVGDNDFAGTVASSYATGAVTGSSTSTGGLVGLNFGTVASSYATGAVTGDRATGGLVGQNGGGTVQTSYATGAVTGASFTGGLVGLYISGTITNAYWDTATSGQAFSAGGIGLTTAQLQSGGLPPGFDSAVWGGGSNGLYPYLSNFYPNGVQAISGIAYTDAGATPLASGSNGAKFVSGLVNGQSVGTVTTGANGYYYIAMPAGTIAAGGSQVAVYSGGATAGATLQENATGSLAGLNIHGTWLTQQATASALSTVSNDLATALGGTALPSLANRAIDTTAPTFTIDQPVNTNILVLSGAGAVTQTAPITATSLALLGAGASYTLTGSGNSIGTLAGNAGSVSLVTSGPLSIGTVGSTAGLATTGSSSVSVAGDLTISAGGSVASGSGGVVLAASGNFINDGGSNAVVASGGGRWLIYSSAPASDVFGGLDSQNTALWNATLASAPPASVSAGGNRYLFAFQPTLTITSTNVSKTYGDDATGEVAAAYTVSGLQPGVAGAFLGDTAAAYSGAPSITSPGAATAGSVGSYGITAAAGTLTPTTGYGLAFVSAGALTVNPKALTVMADDAGKIYGETQIFAGTELTTSGLVNGDTVTSATLASTGAAATATVAGSPYAITASNATGTGLSNYTISYVNGGLTVSPKALTVTADNASKTYGQTLTFAGTEVTTSGLVNGDTVTSATLASTGGAATATVAGSPYAITASNAVGNGLSNYNISYVNGGLTVNPKALTVTVDNASKTYGSTLTFAGTELTTSGLINGDTVTSATLASPGAAAGATVAGGPYAITASNAVGSGVSNYAISYVDGALAVTPKALTVTASNETKTYGSTLTFAAPSSSPTASSTAIRWPRRRWRAPGRRPPRRWREGRMRSRRRARPAPACPTTRSAIWTAL
jgi:filamentous hemagglutinin family protein